MNDTDLPPVQRSTIREICRLLGLDSAKHIHRIVITSDTIQFTINATKDDQIYFIHNREQWILGYAAAQFNVTVPIEDEPAEATL